MANCCYWTGLVRIFPDEATDHRLESAILMEISEDWQTGCVYLPMIGWDL